MILIALKLGKVICFSLYENYKDNPKEIHLISCQIYSMDGLHHYLYLIWRNKNMNIGYACLTVGVRETNFRSCTIKNANVENLLEIIEYNLKSLENIIDYNIKNGIKLFRISSDIIPFGSSEVNKIPWWEVFSTQLSSIGEKIRCSNMRVSMHPGQYTVLNSPNKDVVIRAIDDLNYHNKVLHSLGVKREGKIILHIG